MMQHQNDSEYIGWVGSPITTQNVRGSLLGPSYVGTSKYKRILLHFLYMYCLLAAVWLTRSTASGRRKGRASRPDPTRTYCLSDGKHTHTHNTHNTHKNHDGKDTLHISGNSKRSSRLFNLDSNRLTRRNTTGGKQKQTIKRAQDERACNKTRPRTSI